MAKVAFETIQQVCCRFAGSDLKKARKAVKLNMTAMARYIETYPVKIKHWENSPHVTVDPYTMRRINEIIEMYGKLNRK